MTLTIPNEIIEAIRGGEEIDREKIARELDVYCVTDGELKEIENYRISHRDDGSWQVSFSYNEKFHAEIVLNAPEAEEPKEEGEAIPFWIWLLVALGGAGVFGLIIGIVIMVSRRNRDDEDDDEYDDEDDYDY